MNRISKITESVKTWKALPDIPIDPILGFNQLFTKETNPKKVNLCVGAYADDQGKPWILPSVKMAVDKIFSSNQFSCSYLPMTGDPEFTEESVKLAYGFDPKTGLLANSVPLNRIARTQTISGAGGLYIAFSFVQSLYEHYNGVVYTPTPTWPIHNTMAKLLGFKVENYHYYDLENRVFTFEDLLESLKKIPDRAFVILHCSGHNPTGFDPNPEQWEQIAKLALQKKFLVLMDNAYQGFVSGDIVKDGYPIRLFAENKIDMLVVQSYAKNMGLYGQRTGCLSIIMENEELASKAQNYFGYRNRNVFSNPPRFGSDIARIILKDPQIKAQWFNDIQTMANSINERRHLFIKQLHANNCGESWNYILKQKGMFAFTHLKVPAIRALKEKYAIYMTEDGRMSITGLNPNNIPYVAKALADITMQK